VNKAIGYMLISVVGFAVMNLTVKFLGRLPATELVLFRSLVSIVICLYFLRKARIPVFGNNRTFLILRGVFGVIALSSFFFTLQKLPLASAITIQYLSPIFTALFAIFMLGERVRKLQWLFFAVSFAGIVLVKDFDPNVSPLLLFLGITSAVFAGLAYNCIRKVKDTDHHLVVVFYFPLIAIPVMGVISFFSWETPIGIEWLLLLLMGIFTQIAQVYMTKALQAAEVNEIVGLKYLGIIFALGFDFFIFDERYQTLALVGIALVLLGVLLNIFYKAYIKRKAIKTSAALK
jgi:drug/metabolite transporter (DMT)-like permease